MNSTVDAMLVQVGQFMNFQVKKKSDVLNGVSEEYAMIAALHTMKLQGIAFTGSINEFDKEHWAASPIAYQLLRLKLCNVSEMKVRRLSMSMGLRMITEPDDWQESRAKFHASYHAVASKLSVVAAWRSVGTIMIYAAKKLIIFAGHEEKGGWIFDVTSKGEAEGLGKYVGGVHFTLVPFTENEVTVVASAEELKHIPENRMMHS